MDEIQNKFCVKFEKYSVKVNFKGIIFRNDG